ncbi:DUF1289 domain-containing protein [Paracoccus lutimaris]|uniref:Fe-S protein YdhL (DUF1289 family) n=1 Tax=Paracoccus lutimaris TaxID=1490030 RepID=A0A368ZCC1_9RHOB|nr:DUF1289 domain-containing protein [Paracoccus lutimaris]RCW88134.1 hypothetical protein DFP89_10263 [Paracoccus lutimaris]
MTEAGSAASPCIGTCRIEPASRLCAGCLRNLDEIAQWRSMTTAERQAVNAALPARKLAARRLSAQS